MFAQQHVSALGNGHHQVVNNLSIIYKICVGFTMRGTRSRLTIFEYMALQCFR